MKKLTIIILSSLFLFNIFSQENKSLLFNNNSQPQETFTWKGSGNPFELSYQVDIPLLLSGAGLVIPSFVYEKFFLDEKFQGSIPLDPSNINKIDRYFYFQYNKPLDYTSDALSAGILFIPAVFINSPKNDWLTIATMYAETYILTQGIKEVFKLSINKPRPYFYFDNTPINKLSDDEWNRSFPSGHTSFAFATAAFSTYLANTYYDDSIWKWAIIGGSYALATTQGLLRIFSGSHFTTDVITGALIGTIVGYTVPWLHALTSRSNSPVTVTPLGFNVCLNF